MVTPKKLYRGQPGTSVEVLYTVPADKTAMVKSITLTNTTANKATITLHFVQSGGTPAAQSMIIAAYPVEANDTVILKLSDVLESNETIQALQGSSGAITVNISGVEVS